MTADHKDDKKRNEIFLNEIDDRLRELKGFHSDRPLNYILDEHGNIQPEPDIIKWALWFEKTAKDGSRIIASDRDEGPDRLDIWVSTVFLGLDHSYGNGPPILFETAVFGGVLDGEQDRYHTRDEAMRGHQEMCRRVAESIVR